MRAVLVENVLVIEKMADKIFCVSWKILFQTNFPQNIYTLNKILVEVGQPGIKNESHLNESCVETPYKEL